MNYLLKKILNKFPSDFMSAVSRDISILFCSLIGETHAKTVREKFGVSFAVSFFYLNFPGQITWFRSAHDNLRFSQTLAQRLKADFKFAKQIARILIKMSDYFYAFVKKNDYQYFFQRRKAFFDNLREWFAYHQAVSWGGNYLAEDKEARRNPRIKKTIAILNKSYKYNELVAPLVEKFFAKLEISHLLYDELDNVNLDIKRVPRRRSLIFLKTKRTVLDHRTARLVYRLLMKKINNFYKGIKSFAGTPASKGIFEGQTRLVTDFAKFNRVKPGDILVTTMTRPQYNQYIMRAGAIITDEGGLLSHAAMLSREFKIPCLVGTKFATKVLKNKQLVEVNANTGQVKIIK